MKNLYNYTLIFFSVFFLFTFATADATNFTTDKLTNLKE